jgi:thioredoxin-related protein
MMVKKSVLFFLMLLLVMVGFAQRDSIQPPYKRFPTLPPLQLLLGDSTTLYTKADLSKKKPVLVMLFSPDCSHCQHSAEEMVQQKDDLKDIQIVMATLQSIAQMNAFAETYGLKALPNVVLGKDVNYILPAFYGVHNLPYMAFYKKNGALIRTVDGALPIPKVIALFKESR